VFEDKNDRKVLKLTQSEGDFFCQTLNKIAIKQSGFTNKCTHKFRHQVAILPIKSFKDDILFMPDNYMKNASK
jgi:hypothetical protein